MIFRRKSVAALKAEAESSKLARTLDRMDLVALGLGAIIGSGVFVLSGFVAALYTGPALALAFLIAGFAAGIAGACYAELASVMPVAGSAYTYTYATLGHVFAWLVGWAAILEYSLGSALVAIGWSGYLRAFLAHVGVSIPAMRINVIAFALIAIITAVLARGVKQSAYATAVLVLIKVGVVLVFVSFGGVFVHPANWRPFMPFGVAGVMRGASMLFFAFIGFDAVATAAQETRDPERSVPFGILGSIVVAGLLYVGVAVVLTGLISYDQIKPEAGFSSAIHATGLDWLGVWIEIAAMAGLTSVAIVLLLSQTRILLAMSRDGMMPSFLSRVHPVYQTPLAGTLITGGVAAFAAAVIPLKIVGEVVSVGTLLCFAVVCIGVPILRAREPSLVRPFRVPGAPVVLIVGAVACVYMLTTIPMKTFVAAAIWLVLGIVLYLLLQLKEK